MNYVLWCVIDLTLHLNSLFLLMADSDTQDPEVTASQIQCNEVSFLCRDQKREKKRQRGREMSFSPDLYTDIFICSKYIPFIVRGNVSVLNN